MEADGACRKLGAADGSMLREDDGSTLGEDDGTSGMLGAFDGACEARLSR